MADGSAALTFTPEVEALTAPLWEKVRTRVTPIEWRLHVVGSGPLEAKARRRAAQLGLGERISWERGVASTLVPDRLRTFSVLVQGSLVLRKLRDPTFQALAAMIVTFVLMQVIIAYADLQLTFYRNMVYLGVMLGVLVRLEALDPVLRALAPPPIRSDEPAGAG